MKKTSLAIRLLFLLSINMLIGVSLDPNETDKGETTPFSIEGELKVWHVVTITFPGPEASEEGRINPFLDYRLEVTFNQAEKIYIVPGYFAADGQAAESGATAGNKWRVHFIPDAPGALQLLRGYERQPHQRPL